MRAGMGRRRWPPGESSGVPTRRDSSRSRRPPCRGFRRPSPSRARIPTLPCRPSGRPGKSSVAPSCAESAGASTTLRSVKAVILAGGFGSRLSEETAVRPKPMVEIGGKPILWHIMKIYAAHGIDEFVICLGYKGYLIKEYFANYYLHTCDVTFDLASGDMEVHRSATEPWRVTLVDTGERTMTGGRLRRVLPYLGDEDFCFTYGDGVADIDITALLAFHRGQGTLATVTAVQ